MGYRATAILTSLLWLLPQPALADRFRSSPNDKPIAAEAPDSAARSILGTAWGMTLNIDGTGFYNDVVTAVLKGTQLEANYRPLPYKRAKVEFAAQKNSCLYPSNIGHLLRGNEIAEDGQYIQTMPLVWVESHLFSQPGEAPLASLGALKGKKIAYPNGSALPYFLEQYGADFLPTTDETTKARMLMAGRVQYMSGSLPDNIFVFKSLGLPLPPYNAELALARVGVSVVCHDTPENQEFIKSFDARLSAMKLNGQFTELFLKAGVDIRFIPAD